MKLFVKQKDGTKLVGEIFADGTLFKRVKASRHLHRKFRAWALDSEALQQNLNIIRRIEIYDSENSLKYSVSIGDFLSKSFQRDFGFGLQHFLNLKHWQKEEMA